MKRSERVIFTLPKPLVIELEQYADAVRNGNKSGFVADAIEGHIQQFQSRRHTVRLRKSYAAAASNSRVVAEKWEPLDEETWARLDALERKKMKEPR